MNSINRENKNEEDRFGHHDHKGEGEVGASAVDGGCTVGFVNDDASMTATAENRSTFTIGFKTHFDWLFASSAADGTAQGGPRTKQDETSPYHALTQEEWRTKEDEICSTLRGVGRTKTKGEVGERKERVNADDEDDAVIDMWKLRELALSRGGLLCPSIRRRAWPTLVGAHEQVLQASAASTFRDDGDGRVSFVSTAGTGVIGLVTPSAHDTKALKHDVSQTIWNVEDYLIASREHRKQQEEKLEHFLALQRRQLRLKQKQQNYRKKVSFTPDTIARKAKYSQLTVDTDFCIDHVNGDVTAGDGRVIVNADGAMMVSPTTPPATISTTPTSQQSDEEQQCGRKQQNGDSDSLDNDNVGGDDLDCTDEYSDDDGSSLVYSYDDTASYTNSYSGCGHGTDTDCPSRTYGSWNTQSTPFTLSSRVVRWRKASVQEQKVLYNVVLATLRTEAASSEYFEDDRYHYYAGLQDLCALLMINLESPSLTSLVLTKLAGSHLRDAMRKDKTILDAAIGKTFMPLLEAVDPGLYDHLERNGLTLSAAFSHRWAACWFSRDVPDAAVASRLVDVFLVSHPLMPLYVSVALLTRHRSEIINDSAIGTNLSNLYNFIRGLPVAKLFEEQDRMIRVEEIIATSLSYMKRMPPSTLIENVRNRSQCSNNIAMFNASTLDWCRTSFVPTDHALLKRAKDRRGKADLHDGPCEYEDAEEVPPTDENVCGILFPSLNDRGGDDECVNVTLLYPLAAAAIGYKTQTGRLSVDCSSKRKHAVLLVLAIVCLAMVLFANKVQTNKAALVFLPAFMKKGNIVRALPPTSRQLSSRNRLLAKNGANTPSRRELMATKVKKLQPKNGSPLFAPALPKQSQRNDDTTPVLQPSMFLVYQQATALFCSSTSVDDDTSSKDEPKYSSPISAAYQVASDLWAGSQAVGLPKEKAAIRKTPVRVVLESVQVQLKKIQRFFKFILRKIRFRRRA